jgi:hypothetical protein
MKRIYSFKDVFNEPNNVWKELSLVVTDDVIVGSFDILEELGGGDGGQGLLVRLFARLAVEPDFTARVI